jgi:hypothetical protein
MTAFLQFRGSRAGIFRCPPASHFRKAAILKQPVRVESVSFVLVNENWVSGINLGL